MRIFSVSVSGRPRRSRPSGDAVGEAGVDALDELDRGCEAVTVAMGRCSSLRWPLDVDNYNTSERTIRYQEIADELRARAPRRRAPAQAVLP